MLFSHLCQRFSSIFFSCRFCDRTTRLFPMCVPACLDETRNIWWKVLVIRSSLCHVLHCLVFPVSEVKSFLFRTHLCISQVSWNTPSIEVQHSLSSLLFWSQSFKQSYCTANFLYVFVVFFYICLLKTCIPRPAQP
jgi:hypothetical protein